MSMDICGQTLVLVDNDLTVSEINRKLTNATLKYLFYHSPENRAYSFNLYEHSLCSEEEYVTRVNDLVCKADTLTYEAKDCNIVDTLTEVLSSWKEADFACRDIVLFTDGLESSEINHEKEELYYLINNTDYPVYVVFLNQDNNALSKKTLSAIATTSGGDLIESEFPGEDAEIDKQIVERIFADMDQYAQAHWNIYEESEDDESGDDEPGEETEQLGGKQNLQEGSQAGQMLQKETEQEVNEDGEFAQEDISGDYALGFDSEVILRQERPKDFWNSPYAVISAAVALCLALLVAIFGSMAVMKARRKKNTENTLYNPQVDDDSRDMRTVIFEEPEENLFGDEYATRLLTSDSGITVRLIDEDDEDNVYTIYLGCDMSIGRKPGECDVVIEGDDALSKCHCKLSGNEGEVFISDLSSSNGTFVNGKRIKHSLLNEGDKLKIGSRSYNVRFA